MESDTLQTLKWKNTTDSVSSKCNDTQTLGGSTRGEYMLKAHGDTKRQANVMQETSIQNEQIPNTAILLPTESKMTQLTQKNHGANNELGTETSDGAYDFRGRRRSQRERRLRQRLPSWKSQSRRKVPRSSKTRTTAFQQPKLGWKLTSRTAYKNPTLTKAYNDALKCAL
eukprot:scaffold133365_cov31-Prasinocladus_malaysianus.AAC.1